MSPVAARYAPETIRSRLRERSEITGIHLLDLESALLDERWNVARHVAALKRPVEERLHPFLPATDRRIRREAMFEENEFAVWLQHSCDALNRFHHAGNRA